MQLSLEDQRDDNKQLFLNWDMEQSKEYKADTEREGEAAPKFLVPFPIYLEGGGDSSLETVWDHLCKTSNL